MMKADEKNRWIYHSAEGSREMRDLLGGKGANFAEMTRILGADLVPRGFTITTEACREYMANGHFPDGLDAEVAAAVSRLEAGAGRRFGDTEDPLLVSVRSGARVSMPGMMDTVLNLGLNAESVAGLARATGNERFAADCHRRFVQMFGNVVRGIDSAIYEREIETVKADAGTMLDSDLGAGELRMLVRRFELIYSEHAGEEFPSSPSEQLREAIGAVFESWRGPRAVEYRRQNRIPDEWGTAVNVQQMVYGNRGPSSGSGVAFSRDELTGDPQPSGDFLVDAQGEDVVSGVRNTRELAELGELMPEIYGRLLEVLRRLEGHFKDMQDVEFTVEEGHLYILQSRSAKRPAQAAVRFAADAVAEGLLTRAEALRAIDADHVEALLHPVFDPEAEVEVLTRGVGASPGAAGGGIVFTAQGAVERAAAGEDVILVRPFTEAEDVAGFDAARGILTSEGGKASHAALVARGMGRPCVCGASELEIDLDHGVVRIGETELSQGDWIAIDGTDGRVTTDHVPLSRPQPSTEFERILMWADEARELGVRANADSPADAALARTLGAEGVGLCRTEHMFMATERQPLMRQMIMAGSAQERAAALERLEPLQREDFEGIFRAMTGQPVTVRLLDPPLHEFLPDAAGLMLEIERLEHDDGGDAVRLAAARHELARVNELAETNPMLGTRGCRLGITLPEIYEMQVRAIIGAALSVSADPGAETPQVEIMIPLVNYEAELSLMRKLVERTADSVIAEAGVSLAYEVGTMIELPRACLQAGSLAAHADFFSFGTNDLTQTALGCSRDDAERGFLTAYGALQIVEANPFESIDEEGVGELVRIAAERGRAAKPALTLGVCGEHGGDPRSIRFFAKAGLDYVSCSPFRVPVARIAAAQAALDS